VHVSSPAPRVAPRSTAPNREGVDRSVVHQLDFASDTERYSKRGRAERKPLSTGENALAIVRAVLVMPAVTVCSSGSTTAMLYDLRDGTSICDMVARKKRHSTASHGVGISGTSTNNTLDGACMYTVVLSNPMRAAGGCISAEINRWLYAHDALARPGTGWTRRRWRNSSRCAST
jgi:hypothetical protein